MSESQEHRFLGSGVDAPHFEALSHQGSGSFKGLEVFDNPGCVGVIYTSDEVVLKCPVTSQPDYYTCEIALQNPPKLIESKSLKLYFNMLHEMAFAGEGVGMFCEKFAVFLRGVVSEVTECEEQSVRITLTQKSRGGISIKAIA